ncbi:type II toxin-antitoxin system VapC family toxin [Thermosulfurimonas sp. F29]|uniref:type II toxin-antitoxin system VapC family toxin n=1 Tax=Thermosulfurimonas sp. F29 TaxID=2867247 RepID=UPI001C83CF11|nr:type II toxin-antitoxin system VapC family toxin [Thermosulfurimonas sp. F29]MBX6423471.1 type II toxin-antitoxin system VapC family toxin [Thermosulfurimonas sp. F29]
MNRVLDASALLAFLHKEPGAEFVELERSVISAVNWSEVLYKCLSWGVDIQGLREDLEALGLSIEPFTLQDAELAAGLWPQTRSLGLSLGDRACLALGLRLGLPVITADRSWKNLRLDIEVRVIR